MTEAGKLLERRARMILDEVRRTKDEIRNLGAEPKGDFQLGLTGTISGLLSVPLVLQARQRFPQIYLTIAEAMSGFVMDWLREGKVDIAVLYLPVMDAAFRSDRILQEELVLLAPVRSYLSAPCRFPEISAQPMILPTRNTPLRPCRASGRR